MVYEIKITRDSIVCVGDLFWLQEKHGILRAKPSHTPNESSLWWSNSTKTSRTLIFQEILQQTINKLSLEAKWQGCNDLFCRGGGWLSDKCLNHTLFLFCFPRRQFKMQIPCQSIAFSSKTILGLSKQYGYDTNV